jgi:hypothetical protein
MIMTQERMILKGQVQLDDGGFVRKAAKDGQPIDQVERSLWQSLLRLGTTCYRVMCKAWDRGTSATRWCTEVGSYGGWSRRTIVVTCRCLGS